MGAMSDLREPGIPEPPSLDDDHIGGDRVEQLLRLAGPREAVPADRMRRVKAAVRAEWRQETRARSRRMASVWSLGALAAAALVLIALRLAVSDRPAVPEPRLELATVEVLSGAVRLVSSSDPASEPTLFRIGDRIREGDGVDTTSGGLVGLRLTTGASVRVDRGTRLRLMSHGAMFLDEGAVYVDSGDRPDARSIEVRTTLGVARDIGTKFEVRLNGSSLRVRVRDGLVRLSQSRESHEASPGDELTLDGDGSVVRRTVPLHGPEWHWAAALARPFDLEGRSLRDFLNWIAEENGWQLQYADGAVEEKAVTTILHGSIQGLTPDEALSAVLPASGVGYLLKDGVLRIRLGVEGSKN
jgi:ferric-dicitrate binding protein FerR (iron transport regulator)